MGDNSFDSTGSAGIIFSEFSEFFSFFFFDAFRFLLFSTASSNVATSFSRFFLDPRGDLMDAESWPRGEGSSLAANLLFSSFLRCLLGDRITEAGRLSFLAFFLVEL